MTVKVTYGNDSYNFNTAEAWVIDNQNGQLDVKNTNDEVIATFLKWDNVQLIETNSPKINLNNNTQIRDYDLTGLFEKMEHISKLGKGFFG